MHILSKLFIVVLSTTLAYSCTQESSSIQTAGILIAPLSQTPAAEGLVSESKLDAAVQFLNPHIPSDFIAMQQRDSVAELLRDSDGKADVRTIASEMHANRIAFFNIDRIENLLRVDTRIVNTSNGTEIESTGFGVLRYKDKESNEFIVDPTLLQAVANSLASIPDSSISDRQSSQPVVVCGGFAFTSEEPWNQSPIFTDKILNSYSAVVEVTKGMTELGKLVVVDVDTRDSMLAKQGYYMIENYTGASSVEIQELRKYGVEYYVSGEVNGSGDAIEVVAVLYSIKNETLELKREALKVESKEWETVQSALVHLTQRICKDETTWK